MSAAHTPRPGGTSAADQTHDREDRTMSKPLSEITVGDFVAQGDGDQSPYRVRVMRVTATTDTAFTVEDQRGREIHFARDGGRETAPGDDPRFEEPIRAASGRDMLNAARATALHAARHLGGRLDGPADEFDEDAAREQFEALAQHMKAIAYARTMAVVEGTYPRDHEAREG